MTVFGVVGGETNAPVVPQLKSTLTFFFYVFLPVHTQQTRCCFRLDLYQQADGQLKGGSNVYPWLANIDWMDFVWVLTIPCIKGRDTSMMDGWWGGVVWGFGLCTLVECIGDFVCEEYLPAQRLVDCLYTPFWNVLPTLKVNSFLENGSINKCSVTKICQTKVFF